MRPVSDIRLEDLIMQLDEKQREEIKACGIGAAISLASGTPQVVFIIDDVEIAKDNIYADYYPYIEEYLINRCLDILCDDKFSAICDKLDRILSEGNTTK